MQREWHPLLDQSDPHWAIERRGVDVCVARYLKDRLIDCSTTITVAGYTTQPIAIRTGVKQDDHLLPCSILLSMNYFKSYLRCR